MGYNLFPEIPFEHKFVFFLPAYGLAIAYKREKYELLNEKLVTFDLKAQYGGDSDFTRNDKVILGLFKSKASGKHFIVATTHIYFMNE